MADVRMVREIWREVKAEHKKVSQRSPLVGRLTAHKFEDLLGYIEQEQTAKYEPSHSMTADERREAHMTKVCFVALQELADILAYTAQLEAGAENEETRKALSIFADAFFTGEGK